MLGLLVVRADAGSYIGAGNLLRCLSVATEWQKRGGWSLIATKCDREQITNRIQAQGIECVPLKSSYPDPRDIGFLESVLARSGSYAGASPNKWVLLDGQRFDQTYQKQVKDLGVNLTVIDDMAHLDFYEADVIINHHLYADTLKYNCPPNTRVLLGPRYCLMGHSFRSWTNWRREVADSAKRVLVTFGGADPHDVTSKVIRALESIDIPDLEVKIVAGPANDRLEALETAARASKADMEVLWNVSNMPSLMAWADVAVSSASTTAYELAFMGLPGLLIISADDQSRLGPAFSSAGAARSLGRHTDVTEKDIAQELRDMLRSKTTRSAMSEAGRNLVDGNGPSRAVEALGAGRLKIRLAELRDCQPLWKLANDPLVRRYSFSKDYIEWEVHEQWFAARMEDENCKLYVVTDHESSLAAQIRFDITGDKAEVSVSVISDKRGMGLGSMVIRMGIRELTSIHDIGTIYAHVHAENMASIKAFQKAGFVSKEYSIVQNQDALHLVWSKVNSFK